ncbi:MAG TPA: hypothetical protein VMQ38_14765 [Mycobacterium sp.]|nr:hypothetical protein [Mycobacterium sp.]
MARVGGPHRAKALREVRAHAKACLAHSEWTKDLFVEHLCIAPPTPVGALA